MAASEQPDPRLVALGLAKAPEAEAEEARDRQRDASAAPPTAEPDSPPAQAVSRSRQDVPAGKPPTKWLLWDPDDKEAAAALARATSPVAERTPKVVPEKPKERRPPKREEKERERQAKREAKEQEARTKREAQEREARTKHGAKEREEQEKRTSREAKETEEQQKREAKKRKAQAKRLVRAQREAKEREARAERKATLEPLPEAERVVFFTFDVHHGRLRRRVRLAAANDGIHVGRTYVPWSDVRAVGTQGGTVRIGTERGNVSFTPDLDGVGEPSLAPLVTDAILDASGQARPRERILNAIESSAAGLRQRFHEKDDDPLIAVMVLAVAACVTAFFALLLPGFVAALFRGGDRLPPEAFLIYPHLSTFDPRVFIAALLLGALAASALLRILLRRQAQAWATGVRRGWSEAAPVVSRGQRVPAEIVAHPLPILAGLVVVLALLVPLGRERVLVDAGGLHLRATLPSLDRDISWSEVESMRAEREGEQFVVTFHARDGTQVTTRDAIFFGLSPFELGRSAERWRAQAR